MHAEHAEGGKEEGSCVPQIFVGQNLLFVPNKNRTRPHSRRINNAMLLGAIYVRA
jgi:hypothetical protein